MDMTETIIECLAAFTADSRVDALNGVVIHETKRIILDPVGCALAARVNRRALLASRSQSAWRARRMRRSSSARKGAALSTALPPRMGN